MLRTIVDKVTGKVLYCRFDEPTEPNEIAIDKVCAIETENEIYYNFDTQEFYINE